MMLSSACMQLNDEIDRHMYKTLKKKDRVESGRKSSNFVEATHDGHRRTNQS